MLKVFSNFKNMKIKLCDTVQRSSEFILDYLMPVHNSEKIKRKKFYNFPYVDGAISTLHCLILYTLFYIVKKNKKSDFFVLVCIFETFWLLLVQFCV